MPNLTDVLNAEDEPTVEEIAQQVCWALDGSNEPTADLPIPSNINLVYDVTTLANSGLKWVAPNGTWFTHAIHGTGMVTEIDGAIKLEIRENAGRLTTAEDGMYWDNDQVLVSSPVATADPVVNIMSLTQAEYDALSPNYQANTLYIING